MKRQICICLSILFTVINTVEINAQDVAKNNSQSSENELIKTLPTALLEDLHRDLQVQETQLNKNIADIAGISKARLEAEIISRQNEDRSKTINTREIDPKQLPGDLLKYIAEHGVSYNGCTPQEAIKEINNRLGIASDIAGIAVKKAQEEHTLSKQKEAAEEFANREDLEEMNTTINEIKNTVESGENPSIVKQTEYMEKKEQSSSDITSQVLKNAVEDKTDVPSPHGYNSEKQTELSPEEIQTLKDNIEKRNVLEEKSEDNGLGGIWQRVKKKVSDWFSDDSDKSDNRREENVNASSTENKTAVDNPNAGVEKADNNYNAGNISNFSTASTNENTATNNDVTGTSNTDNTVASIDEHAKETQAVINGMTAVLR